MRIKIKSYEQQAPLEEVPTELWLQVGANENGAFLYAQKGTEPAYCLGMFSSTGFTRVSRVDKNLGFAVDQNGKIEVG